MKDVSEGGLGRPLFSGLDGVALASLVGLIVMFYAYVVPWLIPG